MEEITIAGAGSISVLIYLLCQLPAIAGALLLARYFGCRNRFEYLAAAGLLFTAVMIAIPGVLGMAGLLTPSGVMFASWGFGAAAFLAKPKRPAAGLPFQPFTPAELLLTAVAWGFLACQWRAFSLVPTVGTDSQLYHIFYPATWLRTGSIERMTQHGMMTATYPFYGELIYAWQMAPLLHDFFARSFQFYFLGLAWITLAAGALAAGFRRIEALAAGLLLVFAGVVFRNASVSNTDLMTGAMLLGGVMWFVIAARRNSCGAFLLAGLSFGIAAGMKYLGLMLAPPAFLLGALVIWFGRPQCRRNLWSAFAAAAVAGSPCFIVNWITYGNPVFPARIGIGSWNLFEHFMTVQAPAIGWRWAAWGFFVNEQENNVSFGTALLVVSAVAAGGIAAGCLRRCFRRTAAGAVAAGFVLLLLLQLAIYPTMTQPRQIVPLVMLAMFPAAVLFRAARGRAWIVAVAALVLAGAESFRQYAYGSKGVELLVHIAVCFVIFGVPARIAKPKYLWGAAVLFAVVLVPDAGLRLVRSDAVASQLRIALLSPEDETARLEIRRRTGGEPCVIAYIGVNYYLFSGDEFENRVIAVPVSESGRELLSDYRTFEEMRTPGSFEAWLARLRREGVRFVICDLRLPPAPGAEQEAEWARSHPEWFTPVIYRNGFYCFELKTEADHE